MAFVYDAIAVHLMPEHLLAWQVQNCWGLRENKYIIAYHVDRLEVTMARQGTGCIPPLGFPT
jgi:hypothetical protein